MTCLPVPTAPRLVRWTPILLLLLLGAVACADRTSMLAPEADEPLPEGLISHALTCTVVVQTATMECTPSGTDASDGPSASSAGDLIVGGQHQYIRMASANPAQFLVDGTIPGRIRLRVEVTVENLIGQALGTADGETLHGDGVRVFYHSGPTATRGSGTVTVLAIDGTATYTAEDQPFYQYDQILVPGQTSEWKHWWWEFHSDVEAFAFQVFVVGQVQHRHGWIDVSPGELGVGVNASEQLTAVAYTVVGAEDTGASYVWESSHTQVATVDDTGLVTGVSEGYAQVTVTSGERSETVNITVGDPTVHLTSVGPDPLLHGQSATLTGEGFNAVVPEENLVEVDGVVATILAVTPTTLEFQVPSPCLPLRSVEVAVTVGTSADQLATSASPASFVTLAAGDQMIVEDPADFCLQFDASANPEAYLLGVQRVSDDLTFSVIDTPTPVSLTSVLESGIVAAPPLAAPQPTAPRVVETAPDLDPETQELLRRHYEFKAQTEPYHVRNPLRTFRIEGAGPWSVDPIDPGVAEDDIIQEGAPNSESNDWCEDPTIVDAKVRKIGTYAIFLEDVLNDYQFSDDQIQAFSDDFDTFMHLTAVDYFGEPSDIDGNGRIKVLITKAMNSIGALGFVTTIDWDSKDECAMSSEGEIFYMNAPTSESSATGLMNVMPRILGHEFVHIIQFGRRIDQGAGPQSGLFMSNWEMEGQATFAEEVIGHVATNRQPGQNYGYDVAWNTTNPTWYRTIFRDHRNYFGFNTTTPAPEQCNWLTYTPYCGTTWLNYAIPALFLRWMSDHINEKQIHRDLINGQLSGFANLEQATGESINTMLAQWGAMLYVDDRIAGAHPRLTLPSWNLYNIFEENFTEDQRLTPRERSFASFVDELGVRSANSGYFRISGEERGATAIRVRDAGDDTLPANMQIWLVRLH